MDILTYMILENELQSLRSLKEEHVEQLDLALEQSALSETRKQTERRRRLNDIARKFEDFEHWIENTWETQEDPYIQVIAVITGNTAREIT